MPAHRPFQRRWLQHLLAAALVLFAALIRLNFLEALGLRAAYITFYPAVTLSAVAGGLYPGLLATLISAFLASYFWIEPVGHPFAIRDAADTLSMFIFLLSGAMISITAEMMHRAQNRASLAEALVVAAEAKEQVREEVRVLSARLQLATRAASIGIWDLEIASNRLIWDDWMFRLYGITPESFSGHYADWEQTLHPDDREKARQEYQAALRGEKEYNTVFRVLRSDGSLRYIQAHAVLLLSRTGQPHRIVGTNADITDRWRAEEALKESEERYRAILQQSSDAIALVDIPTGNILEVNNRWLELLGYTAQEALMLQYSDIIDDEDRHFLVSSTDSRPAIRRLRQKNGRTVAVEWSSTMIGFAGKRVAMMVSRDLSAERKLQEQIQKDVLLAANIQKSLLPKGFYDVFLTVETIYAPSHLVSGDFYDYAWNQDNTRFSGFVLDIAGHGVASSLQGIVVSNYFRDVLNSPMRLPAKLEWINRHVLRYFTEDTYAAAIYFEFDFARQTLTFATAGIFCFLTSSAVLPVTVKQGGSFIGITDAPEYMEKTVPIRPGESFYFMSDGIFDQIEDDSILNPEDFDSTVSHLRGLTAGPQLRDDSSALCVRVNGHPRFPVRFELHRPGEYSRVRTRIRELLRRISPEQSGIIEVALGEALNNGARESMDVRIKISLLGCRLVIRVRDGGPGFNGNERLQTLLQTESTTLFESLLYEEGGRGILIMSSWMDRVLYNRRGNEVLLVKKLPASLSADSILPVPPSS